MSDVEQTPSEEATLLSRGYRLVKKLGEGSYAKVYKTSYANDDDKTPRQELACKIIDTSHAPKDFVRKFLPRELDILVKLNHPHIVHIHSIFQRRSKYYVFMRFAENGDLLEFILTNGTIAECQARVWLRQLALGVQYLHDLEIAHRDLKCENVLISANFNVKLADFGFARQVVDSKGKRVLSETYCGSLSYAAPEILRGSPYNPKISDIWSLGIVLYIMLNKAMPFDDTNIKRLHEQQTTRRWKFRAKVADILSDQVKKLITNLLEPDVAKRFRMDQVLNSEWVAMDPRLLALTTAEQAAVKAAAEEKARRKSSLTSEKKSETKKVAVTPTDKNGKQGETLEEAAAAAAAGVGTVTIIKDVRGSLGPVKSENIDHGTSYKPNTGNDDKTDSPKSTDERTGVPEDPK